MADQQAREGDKVVGEAIAQIERLAHEVVNSSEAMNQLKAESDKIGSVLDVIKSVAQQTNLLALNAPSKPPAPVKPGAVSPWSPTKCAAWPSAPSSRPKRSKS
jgi:hypothetical protein